MEARAYGSDERNIADLIKIRSMVRVERSRIVMHGTILWHIRTTGPSFLEWRAVRCEEVIGVALGLCVKVYSRRHEVDVGPDMRGQAVVVARDVTC